MRTEVRLTFAVAGRVARPVDEDLEPVPFPRRRLAGSPPARRRIQGAELAVLPQTPAVVRHNQALQPVSMDTVTVATP